MKLVTVRAVDQFLDHLLRGGQRRARHAVAPVLGIGIFGYFAFHAIEGDRGLFAWQVLDRDVANARIDLASIREERLMLERRVGLLRSATLDRDMLDEWARRVLNYGAADEVVCFEQTAQGLREVPDPSELFRGHRDRPVAGTCTTVTLEGRRPLVSELQALVAQSTVPTPRRGVTGLDSSRTSMLLAVTNQASDLGLAAKEVFVATAGGVRLADSAADLALCLAVASAASGTALPGDFAAIGEVALSGDIRPVPMLSERVSEAARLGFRTLLVPPARRRGTRAARSGAGTNRANGVDAPAGVTLVEVRHLTDALTELVARGRVPLELVSGAGR